MATITFHGAAQEVTGSCHLLESPALGRVLLDCGLHQGGDAVERLHEETLPFDPHAIDAVVLSHAHLDHSGRLPLLVNRGFDGPIHCTEATVDLLELMLEDAAGLYLRDLERSNLRNRRRGKPLRKADYSRTDVHKALKLCQPHAYGDTWSLGPEATVCFHDAGHILGSAIVEITLTEKTQRKTLVFSGDLGKSDAVLMNDPTPLTHADLVMMEGTYGDRNHRSMDNTLAQLGEILTDTWARGGNVMIPSFAVGRTQEILFHLGRLHQQGALDNWQIFLDSPMAIKATRLYDRWFKLLDHNDVKHIRRSHHNALVDFLPNLNCAVSTDESMAINRVKAGAIIIAGSGMCTGGRIRHHFKQRIWNARNTLLFIGFQARNTLGRQLVDGARHIKLFQEDYVVKARIETLGGFSAHADQSELMRWIGHFEGSPRVVLVHGEPKALDTLSHKLWTENQRKCEIPAEGQSLVF
ncbi:MBL fold metallo-hydrolase RNA specificity domain-containing protein [Denitromonas halophila]|uniref:MBL fold metallo-hydrolase n=1 Tax=Denitromonas halophila TaxID=1629404 RepID=A0A557R0Z5_9RHOO|nr:MBL fold metallo-hydrolase [Denitromonas halophila]TVO58786.1 MBL fold metallo-hydrolase [Denitromonas halophila]